MPQPTFVAAGAPHEASATGATHPLPSPASVPAGDYLVAVLGGNTLVGIFSPPAGEGWTPLPGGSADAGHFDTSNVGGSTALRLAVFYKESDGSEPATHDFTSGTNIISQGRIYQFTDVDSSNPLGGITTDWTSNTSPPGGLDFGDITSLTTDMLIVRTGNAHTGTSVPAYTAPTGHSHRGQACSVGGIASRAVVLFDKPVASGGTEGTANAPETNGTVFNAFTTVGFALLGTTAGGPATETLEPDAVVGTPTGLTVQGGGTALAALQAAGGAYLGGTDPSGSTGSDGPEYASATAAVTGWTGLTSAANATGSGENTYATAAPAAGATAGALLTYNGLFAQVPDTATITKITVEADQKVSNANRGNYTCQLALNTTLFGSASTAGASNTADAIRAVEFTTGLPSVAQIKTNGFGARIGYTRTGNTATWSLDWVRITVEYTMPGSTTPTNVRVALENPVDPLVPAGENATVTARLRKLGNGTDPTAAIRVRRAGSNTDLGAQTGITVSESSFTDKTYTFDQDAILGTNGSDFEVYVESAGASGGLVEVDYIKADVRTEAAGTTPVSGQRTTSWNIDQTKTGTRATSWNIDQTKTGTRATSWDILQAVTASRTTQWNIDQQRTGQRATSWNIDQTRTGQRATSWDILQAISGTRATSWAIAQTVLGTRATSWDVLGLTGVSGQRATSWNIAQAVAGSRLTAWDIAQSISGTRATSWAVDGRTGGTRATSWDIAQTLLGTRATQWNVEAFQPVTGSRATSWDILQQIAGQRATSWGVLQAVGGQRVTSWDILQTLVGSRATQWSITQTIGGQRTTIWGVGGVVTGARATSWNVGVVTTPVSGQRLTSWDILQQIAGSRQTAWNLAQTLTGARPTSWHVLQTITGQRVTLWEILQAIGGQRATQWHVMQLAEGTRLTSWNIEQTLTGTRVTTWDIILVTAPDTLSVALEDSGVTVVRDSEQLISTTGDRGLVSVVVDEGSNTTVLE